MLTKRQGTEGGFVNGMYSCLYLSSVKMIHSNTNTLIYVQTKEEHWYWVWKNRKFDNYNMALVLIEILYEKQLINDATYNKIMKSNHYIEQFNN